MNDEMLYAQVLTGSHAALEELVARYYGPLRGYFYHLTGENMQDAEDLTQETFVRILRSTGTPPEVFRLWLFRIARNLAYDHFRSASYRRERVSISLDIEDTGEEKLMTGEAGYEDEALPEEAALVHAAADQLTHTLKRLPALHREALVLRFYQGMKIEEIAELTGRPAGTIKSRLFHGLRMLKEIWMEAENANG